MSERSRVPRKRTTAVLGFVLIVVFCGCLVYLNAGIDKVPLRPTGGSQFAKACVDDVLERATSSSPEGVRCRVISASS